MPINTINIIIFFPYCDFKMLREKFSPPLFYGIHVFSPQVNNLVWTCNEVTSSIRNHAVCQQEHQCCFHAWVTKICSLNVLSFAAIEQNSILLPNNMKCIDFS